MIFSESRQDKRGLSQPHTTLGGNIKLPKKTAPRRTGSRGFLRGWKIPLNTDHIYFRYTNGKGWEHNHFLTNNVITLFALFGVV